AKLATEHLAMTYHRQHGFPAVAVRPFNIYGPRQVGEGAVHHFIVRALRGEPLEIHNDGSQIRAWTYIDDILDAVERVLTDERAVGHSFNIGNPRSTVTIYNLAREIVRLSSSGSPIVHVEWDHPDVELRVPSVGKAKELLDWSAQVDLEEGLLRTIYWYRSRK
ncbi:MAG: NAD-dependent epimerase/dehydratase family protein, partial [Polyangia bacterium]